MELVKDHSRLKSAARDWFQKNKYVPNIGQHIESKSCDPTTVETWIPYIYWIVNYPHRLVPVHGLRSNHRKFLYYILQTALTHCPLDVFDYIIRYTRFNKNKLKPLISNTMPMDKLAFFHIEHNMKLCYKALIGKLSITQIAKLHDALLLSSSYNTTLESDSVERLMRYHHRWLNLCKLCKPNDGFMSKGIINRSRFKTLVLNESVVFQHLMYTMDKNLVYLTLSYL